MKKSLFIAIVLCAALLAGQSQAAVNVQFRGSLNSSFFWTPENALDGRNQFSLTTDLNGVSNRLSGYILFSGINRPLDSLFQETPTFSMKISRAWLRVSTPIFKNDPRNVTFTLGDIVINYSPYTVRTGVSGTAHKRGFSFEGLQAGPVVVGGFLFSDQRPTSLPTANPGVVRVPRIAYGTKMMWQLGTATHLTGIGVEYKELNASWNDENNALVFAEPKERDQVLSFELRHRIGSLSLEGMYSNWNNVKLAAPEMTKAVKQISVSMPLLSGLTLKALWRDFEPGFEPRYRDKMPLFYNESYRGGNPLDRYAGQKGYYLEGVLNQPGYNLNLKHDSYLDQNTEMRIAKDVFIGTIKEADRDLTVKLKNKTTLLDYRHNFTEHFQEYKGSVRLNKGFVFAQLPMTRSYYTKFSSSQKGELETATGLELKWQLNRGRLAGAKLSLGAEQNRLTTKPLRVYSTFDYTLPGGIWFTCRYAYPNLLEPSTEDARWDDDFREGMVVDNYLGLGARISF